MRTMIWTLVSYENPENFVIIYTFAKILICADIIFALLMLLIFRSKIKKELTSDTFCAHTKI